MKNKCPCGTQITSQDMEASIKIGSTVNICKECREGFEIDTTAIDRKEEHYQKRKPLKAKLRTYISY